MADVITIIKTLKPSVIVTMVTLDYFVIQLIIAAQIHAVTMANVRIPPQVSDVPVNRDTQATTVRKLTTVVKILVVHMGDAQMIAEPTGVLVIADIQEHCVAKLLTIAVQTPVYEGNVLTTLQSTFCVNVRQDTKEKLVIQHITIVAQIHVFMEPVRKAMEVISVLVRLDIQAITAKKP